MQVKQTTISKTRVSFNISTSPEEMTIIKDYIIKKLSNSVKVAGFRAGKAPLNVIEKHLDQQLLQSEFLDKAINDFYTKAVKESSVKVFGSPNITLTKFVPFTTLEFNAETDILSKIKLAEYKKIKKTKPKIKVETKDIQEVINSLKSRMAERKSQTRSSKIGDELIIDFDAVDTKKQPIKGADGIDYPLVLGSDSFIPGFETNLVGVKANTEKTFTLTFPKNYDLKALANKKATFSVKVKIVNKLIEPKIDDDFAAKVGPFKNLTELKSDIKKHLLVEKQQQADRKLENEIILEVVDGSSLDLPQSLIDEQLDRLKNEVKQNILYRGQTWQEMLDSLKTTEEEYERTELLPEAKRRVKTGLVLAEISSIEGLEVSNEEIDQQIANLWSQYKDAKMQAELSKPESRQEIASRIITDKTLKLLVQLATE